MGVVERLEQVDVGDEHAQGLMVTHCTVDLDLETVVEGPVAQASGEGVRARLVPELPDQPVLVPLEARAVDGGACAQHHRPDQEGGERRDVARRRLHMRVGADHHTELDERDGAADDHLRCWKGQRGAHDREGQQHDQGAVEARVQVDAQRQGRSRQESGDERERDPPGVPRDPVQEGQRHDGGDQGQRADGQQAGPVGPLGCHGEVGQDEERLGRECQVAEAAVGHPETPPLFLEGMSRRFVVDVPDGRSIPDSAD